MTQIRPVQVHFDDLDAMGLLHNSRYALLVERAISAFWTDAGWHHDPTLSAFTDIYMAVREFKVTYHAPIMGAGQVRVEFWLDKLGNTSGVYGFRVLSEDGETVHADGYRVMVNLDQATFRPTPFSDRIRRACEPLMRELVPGSARSS